MPTLYADLHTHTIASDHAFSTILENAQYAASQGIGCIAMTDHTYMLGDAPHPWYFGNLTQIPDYLYGVRILKGAEVNLLPDGGVDMEEDALSRLEWVIASIHSPAFGDPINEEAHTRAYINALQNPYIDALGHSGLAAYPYDFDAVVHEAAKLGKLIEINEHTFDARAASVSNCEKIAQACKKYSTGIVIGSDAHFAYNIGKNSRAIEMLSRIGVPMELLVTRSEESLSAYLTSRKKRLSAMK